MVGRSSTSSFLSSSLFSALAVAALTACAARKPGASTTPDAPDPLPGGTAVRVADGDGPGGQAVADADVTPAAICGQIFNLRASNCALVQEFDLTQDECLAEYRRALEERGAEARTATVTAGHCLLDQADCDAASACFGKLNSDANNGQPETLRECSQTEVYAPVGMSQADWAVRNGAGATRFGDVESTTGAPVEVCGIPAEMDWLMVPTCNDGSRPFDSASHAHAARVGNVGAGGRCGSIIDLYEVPCPEGTYAIYMDAYVCPVPDGQPVP